MTRRESRRSRRTAAPAAAGAFGSAFEDSGARLIRSAGRLEPLRSGAVVAGRFLAEQRVASGAMGEVWIGHHSSLRFRVALKSLLPEACGNHEVVARFKREAYLLGLVQSDHVARVLDFVVDDVHGPVLVMEYVGDGSLGDQLRERKFSVEETVSLGIELAKGVRDLHRANIVHRDLKPGNVVLKSVDGRMRAMIVDFGISRLVHGPDSLDFGMREDTLTCITRHDVTLGTIEYMAPEQILSASEVSWPADLYALGAILHRAASGRHVFHDLSGMHLARAKLTRVAPPLVTGRSDRVAAGLEALVARALERSPTERYECADEMLADLSLLHDTEVATRTRTSIPPPPLLPTLAPPRSQPAPTTTSSTPVSSTPVSSGEVPTPVSTNAAPAEGRRDVRAIARYAAVLALGAGIGLATHYFPTGRDARAGEGAMDGLPPAPAPRLRATEARSSPPSEGVSGPGPVECLSADRVEDDPPRGAPGSPPNR